MRGYKCFNSDMTNIYGFKYEVGKKYIKKKALKIGIDGHGFHMCEKMEDTLKYFGAMNTEIIICEVIGSGEILYSWDDYYCLEKYATSELEIVRIIPREEIIEMALQFNDDRALRFIQLYKLTPKEIELFEEKFSNDMRVLKAIEYYQKGNTDVYNLDYLFKPNCYRRVKK